MQGRQTVTVLPGDGVGPELLTSVKEVFTASRVPVDFEEIHLRYAKPVLQHAFMDGISRRGGSEAKAFTQKL